MWYTIDGGLINITFTSNGTIDQGNWSSLIDGVIMLTFYANDTVGQITSKSVIIIKDTTDPTINIILPILNHPYNEIAPDYIVEIYDANLDAMWYTIDGGLTNITFTSNGTINQDNWATLDDGLRTIIFFSNDTLGNVNSESVTVLKDSLMPQIWILSPTINEEFGAIAPSFNVEYSDENGVQMWYTIDNGAENFTFSTNTTINQEAWDDALEGSITLEVFIEDIAGNINYESVLIRKELPPPGEEVQIPGYHLMLIVTLVGIMTIIAYSRLKRNMITK